MKQKLPLNAPAAARAPAGQSEVSGVMSLDSDHTQLKRVSDDLLSKARSESVPPEERKTAPPAPNTNRSDDHTAVFRPPPELLARSRAAAQARKQAPPPKPVPEPVTPVAAAVAEQTGVSKSAPGEPAPVVTASVTPLAAAEHHSWAPEAITAELALPAMADGHSSEPSLEIGTHYGAEPAAPRGTPTQPPTADAERLAHPSSRPTAPDLSAVPQAFARAIEGAAAGNEAVAAKPGAVSEAPAPAPSSSSKLAWLIALVVLAGVAWFWYGRLYSHQ